MKKSKPPDKPKAYFKNRPFTSLKGTVAATAVPQEESATLHLRKKIRSNDEDDASLFLRAAEGAKRIGNAPGGHDGAAAGPGSGKMTVRAPEDSCLFLAAMQKIGTTAGDMPKREREDAERQSSPSRMKQLKRGSICISQELDLHGFLKDEALIQLEQFVAAAYSGGQRAVLVITGKGINSPEGPVLRGAVADWLRSEGKGSVAEFSSAPRELGGSGAFVVFLKKK